MKNQQKKLLNICLWSAIILFILRCLLSLRSILTDISLYELLGYASEAISVAVFFSGIYESFFWRLNPFEKTPKLSKFKRISARKTCIIDTEEVNIANVN